MDSVMKKEWLRQDIIQKRNAMTLFDISRSNRDILRNFLSLPEYREAGEFFCYIGTVVDIETMPILLNAWQNGKRVLIPLHEIPSSFQTYQVEGPEDLRSGKFGVLEPKLSCKKVPSPQPDFALIPSVCCDRYCNRLGLGNGLYDKFLAERRLHPIASLCRKILLVDELPCDRWDVPLDIVVTEESVIRRNIS